MKVTMLENMSIIEYDDKESKFIDSLDEKSQRLIRRGLATPADFGYKNCCGEYIKLD